MIVKLPLELRNRNFRWLGFYIVFHQNNFKVIYILKLLGQTQQDYVPFIFSVSQLNFGQQFSVTSNSPVSFSTGCWVVITLKSNPRIYSFLDLLYSFHSADLTESCLRWVARLLDFVLQGASLLYCNSQTRTTWNLCFSPDSKFIVKMAYSTNSNIALCLDFITQHMTDSSPSFLPLKNANKGLDSICCAHGTDFSN